MYIHRHTAYLLEREGEGEGKGEGKGEGGGEILIDQYTLELVLLLKHHLQNYNPRFHKWNITALTILNYS